MNEALKEVWQSKFKKAREKEFDVKDIKEDEVNLLKLKIDRCLDLGDEEGFKKFSMKLRSTEHFLALSNA